MSFPCRNRHHRTALSYQLSPALISCLISSAIDESFYHTMKTNEYEKCETRYHKTSIFMCQQLKFRALRLIKRQSANHKLKIAHSTNLFNSIIISRNDFFSLLQTQKSEKVPIHPTAGSSLSIELLLDWLIGFCSSWLRCFCCDVEKERKIAIASYRLITKHSFTWLLVARSKSPTSRGSIT